MCIRDRFGRRGLITHYVIEFFQYAHPWEEILYEDGFAFNRTSLVSNFTLKPVPNNTWFDVNVYGVTRIGDGPTLDTSIRVLTQENGKGFLFFFAFSRNRDDLHFLWKKS